MLIRKDQTKEVMQEHWKNNVLSFSFPMFDQVEDSFVHGFSSRLGGVSEGVLSSMNLSFSRGDQPEHVYENFRRIAEAIGFSYEKMVFTDQTHTTHVRVVTEADCGKGYLLPRDYTEIDGLVTNVPGVILCTFYADCVPLYFVDPVKKAVGLSHSGWRGTVDNIAANTVRAMQENFDSDPKDLLAAIGPSICQDCYEVSGDVIEAFQTAYPQETWKRLFYRKENGKYQLNLWEACRINLCGVGILPEHIEVTDLCTCCNPDVLFSHRASKGKRGNLAAFLGIRETKS